MTRILLVTNDFPPRRGGIQSYLENLVRELVATDDHTLTVYAPKWEGLPRTTTPRPPPTATTWFVTRPP